VDFTVLFNLCITHGFVPDSFGSSVIVPVIKDRNGCSDSYENYRPILLICFPSYWSCALALG
jgi:hypothetical protein